MAQHELEEALLPSSRSPVERGEDNAFNQQQQQPPPQTDEETNRQQSEDQHNNRNIRLALLFALVAFAGRSIWNQSVLATYVYLITNEDSEAVGFITAVMGFAQFLASFPTGYIADKYRRDYMLKVASAVGIVACSATVIELYFIPGNSYGLLVAALTLWGVFWGIANTALSALFADSIPDGYRSYYFTKRSVLINLGNTVGPTLALICFFVLGDNWTVKDCAIVMSLGQAICLPGVILLSFLSDDHVVHGHGNSTTRNTSTEQPATEAHNNSLTEPLLSSSPDGSGSSDESDTEISSLQVDSGDNNLPSCESRNQQQSRTQPESVTFYGYCKIPKQRIAPVLVAIADITSGLASGMSIRYFPIFFVSTLKLSPVQVQVLYLVSPLMQAGLMSSGQYFSERFGRCQVTVAHKWIGIACMLLMVAFAHYELPTWLICLVYVLRTSFMNSTQPLTKSVLMDNVPRNERGRWSSLESVNMFSWSGSAFVGGFLVSLHGIMFNFCITASLQFIATLPLIALASAVDVDEKHCRGHRRTMSSSSSSSSEDGSSSERESETDTSDEESASDSTAGGNNA